MKQIIYKTVQGLDLTADVFLPEGTGPHPAIALFHGGGWVFGKPGEFHGMCERFTAKGFVTVSFQYRLTINEDGTFPNPDITPVESTKDARSALRWLKSNAVKFNIDTDRIAGGGQSAGGQLAMSTVLIDDVNEETDDFSIDPAVSALLLYSSNVNTVEHWVDYIFGERRKEIWSISSYHNIKPGMPPAIAFHGRLDCAVPPHAVEFFQEKMKEAGNLYDLHWFEGRGHYLGEGIEKYATYFDEGIIEQTEEFLKELGFC